MMFPLYLLLCTVFVDLALYLAVGGPLPRSGGAFLPLSLSLSQARLLSRSALNGTKYNKEV